MAEWRRESSESFTEEVGQGWKLESVIGSGGTATVYRARGNAGKAAAVKLMHAHLVGNWSRRFEREARLLSKLKEPTVVELYEFGRKSGVPFLVLELLDGASLDRLELPRQLSARVAAVTSYARQALHALEVVHRRGVLHRDLKPSNLFLTNDGLLKVLDFGAACSEQRDLAKPDSLTSGLLGTPAFMSPEQALGRWDLVDERADVWSLAATLFTLLSGEHVHPGRTRNEQLGRAMSATARSVLSVVPSLDPGFARVLDRALSYRREDRYQSATAFREALEGRLQPQFASFHSTEPEQSTLRHRVTVGPRRAIPRATVVSALSLGLLLAADVSSHRPTPVSRDRTFPPAEAAIFQPATRLSIERKGPETPFPTRIEERSAPVPQHGRLKIALKASPTVASAPTRSETAASASPRSTSAANALDLRLGAKGSSPEPSPAGPADTAEPSSAAARTALDVRN